MRERLCVALLLAACGDPAPTVLPEVTDPAALVDPTIGTGGLGFGHGSCFVGAAVPHGLVKAGPDTSGPFGTVSFLHYSGYWAGDDKIRGFTQVHLHGTGATDYGVLSVMPVTAFDPSKTSVVAYETAFAKADEHAAAGRYDVTLANGIAVSIAATQRAAVYRFTGAGAVVIDLAKTLESGKIDEAAIAIDDAGHTITGHLHHLGGMSAGFGGYTLHFIIHGAWTAHHVWADGMAPSGAASATGTGVGAALDVAGDTQLAIGISLVSDAGAQQNLASEVPAVDVDAVAAAAHAAWNTKLATVLLTGGSAAERRIFYTSLYHAFLMPSVIGDVDGSYVLAGQAAKVASGWHQMSDLSLWDTYRTVASLYAWLAPESARDTARSLVAFGDGLGGYPRWPVATGESGTMLGAPAEVMIADAVLRGVPDAGGALAWPLLTGEAIAPTPPPAGRGERGDVDAYMMYGYVPNTLGRSVSNTTEYAHDDFALAQLAGSLGHTAEHDLLLARSHGWRALFDPSVGFLRGRDPSGAFPTAAFDPVAMTDEYAEANAWQSLWMPGIHDPEGMAMVLGGADAAIGKLTELFENTKHDFDTSDESAANFPRPYYWHGNEPDISAPYLFGQLGRPDLTQQWVRWIEDTQYSDKPDGVAGNDDGGTLGSWYVLATLGLYPIAGSDRWVLGAPRFPQARVIVGGHELAIIADGTGPYVTSVTLDGAPVGGNELTQAQLASASELRFVMASKP